MRYFVDGKEISKEEADKIKKDNQKYMDSNDLSQWEKIKFVVKIAQPKRWTFPPSAGTAPPAPMMAGRNKRKDG